MLLETDSASKPADDVPDELEDEMRQRLPSTGRTNRTRVKDLAVSLRLQAAHDTHIANRRPAPMAHQEFEFTR